MSPVATVPNTSKTATPDGLAGWIYKKTDSSKTVISYYASLTDNNDVVQEMLNLAKGIDKHIVLVDWTCENPEHCFRNYRNSPDYYLIFLGNASKDSKGDRYENTLELDVGVIVGSAFLLDKQFRSYPDEWALFKVPMIKLYDKKGIFYADAIQEYARLFVDLNNLPLFERKLILSQFNAWIIKEIKKFPSIKTVELNKTVQMFKEFLTYGQENTKHQLKDKINSAQSEMLGHYTAIQRLEKTIAETNALYRSFARKISGFNTDFPTDKLTDIFTSFINNKMYNRFVFHDTYFEAYTDEIWCENYGKKYYIGKFKVVVDLSGKVKMHNIVLEKRVDDNDHPHICAGIPCLGNIKEIVPKMIYNGDFIGLLNLLHQFLITYNPAGPYTSLELGWGAPGDWCNRCDHPTLACSCQTCGSCGEPEDSCTCDRCPRYGELMEDVDCGDCDYWKLEDEEDEDSERRCSY